ncbi:MAG: Hpt domain-containing protein [Blastocatellia bacterium]
MKYHLDQEVVTGFISEAKSYLPEIVLGLESFAAAPEHDQSIREAFRYAHIIKGAASMLGFHKISEVAYELEIQLEQLSEHQLALTQELLETLCNNVSELSDLLETALDDSPAPAPPVTDVMSELPLPTLPPVPVATTDFEFSFATFGQDTHDELAAPLSPATEQPLLEANNFSMSFPEAANIPTVGELNLHEVAADLKERFGATPLPPQPEIPLPTEWLSALPTDPFALTPPPTALSRELTPAPVPADAHDKFAQELAEDLLAEARGLATPPPPPLEQVLETISQTAEAIKDEVERDTEPDIPDLLPLPELPELLTPTAGASELEELENIAPPSALEAAFVTARAETEEALPPSTHTQTLTSLGSENTFLQTELPEELLETFLLEAEEHLQVMQSVLRKLERVPSDIEALQEIRRSAHSLKGTASLVGFRNIMHLAHRMEDLLDLVYEEKFALTQQATQLLTRATDMIEDMSGGQINETALHDLYADFATLLDEIDTSPIAVEEAPVAAEPMPLAVEPALLETPPAPVLDTNAEAIESSPNALELVLEDNAEATILDLPEADTTILAEEPMTWELSLLDVADEPALSCAEAPATTPSQPTPRHRCWRQCLTCWLHQPHQKKNRQPLLNHHCPLLLPSRQRPLRPCLASLRRLRKVPNCLCCQHHL